MKKIIKRIVIVILSLVLVFAIGLTASMAVYYPHYRKNWAPVVFDSEGGTDIRVMSCNVRCITPFDFGKKNWFNRADLIANNIRNNMPTVIGFQEVTKWQYKYLRVVLPQFDSVITYRDDMVNSEGCPVFYRLDLYNLVDKGSFWLSETPEEMSKDWDAACYRVCSYIILEVKETGKRFVVFNTHLDHISDEARINGINVVLEKIEQFGSLPSVIMGDFNAGENTETYRSVTEKFLDAKYQLENPMKGATYTNWGAAIEGENIDYFMISKTGFAVKDYKIIRDTYNGVYPSDHFPIFTVLELV